METKSGVLSNRKSTYHYVLYPIDFEINSQHTALFRYRSHSACTLRRASEIVGSC